MDGPSSLVDIIQIASQITSIEATWKKNRCGKATGGGSV